MPEGDIVFRAARSMHRALAGRVLTGTDFRVPRLAAADLTGHTITEVVPRGKHMLTRTDRGLTVHTHFMMDGAWHLVRPGSRWRGGPDHEIRAVLRNAEWTAVGYRLKIVEILPTAAEATAVGHLGPDLLGPDWDMAQALANLRSDPDRPIAESLLDQRNLAGIGNMYKNETLYLRGVHPATPVGAVADLEALVATAQRALRLSTRHAGQATTGNTARGRRRWVYGRGGQPCRRCGTRIRSQMPGRGVERVTYWCPACQPARPAG